MLPSCVCECALIILRSQVPSICTHIQFQTELHRELHVKQIIRIFFVLLFSCVVPFFFATLVSWKFHKWNFLALVRSLNLVFTLSFRVLLVYLKINTKSSLGLSSVFFLFFFLCVRHVSHAKFPNRYIYIKSKTVFSGRKKLCLTSESKIRAIGGTSKSDKNLVSDGKKKTTISIIRDVESIIHYTIYTVYYVLVTHITAFYSWPIL